jgi:hypothetical protein
MKRGEKWDLLQGKPLVPGGGGKGGGGQLNRRGVTKGPVKKLEPDPDRRSDAEESLRVAPTRGAPATDLKLPEHRPRPLTNEEMHKRLGLDYDPNYKPPSTFKTPKFRKGGMVHNGRDYGK